MLHRGRQISMGQSQNQLQLLQPKITLTRSKPSVTKFLNSFDTAYGPEEDDNNNIHENYRMDYQGHTSIDNIGVQNKRVTFTIGDGEDLSSIFENKINNNFDQMKHSKFASTKGKRKESKLVVLRREPSLEITYEKLNSKLSAMDHKQNAMNKDNSIGVLNNDIRLEKNKKLIPLVANKMEFDPNSQFFQLFHLNRNFKRGLLGDGSFSVCCRCILKETNQEFAVKIISRRIDASREIKLLRQCQDHPNIVKLYDVYQDQFNTYIVCEYLRGGELLERIRKKKCFTEAQACSIFRGLVSAVDYLHSKRIVHRDLKPEVSFCKLSVLTISALISAFKSSKRSFVL